MQNVVCVAETSKTFSDDVCVAAHVAPQPLFIRAFGPNTRVMGTGKHPKDNILSKTFSLVAFAP